MKAGRRRGEATSWPQAIRAALFFHPGELDHFGREVGIDIFRNKLVREALFWRQAEQHWLTLENGVGLSRGGISREALILHLGKLGQFYREVCFGSFGNVNFGEAVADVRGEKLADLSVKDPPNFEWCAEYQVRNGGPILYRELGKSAPRVWPGLLDGVSKGLERASGIKTNARKLGLDWVTRAKAKKKKKVTKDHDGE